ncbi:thiol reductant ABC exporter subunit CydD [Nocardioides jishulii]|uniref:Thiol reductant ABC exporter subunit CydD n=1 Tax=Nocardioides jishulii TaxID=2575440 RepID=A0A4U2YNL6_9ACTN|nr:thiol reductant ABC exporter subunit CydD [Nocardioides jishulii]QCX27773.1 thiol reductant ABC exporter subunit CydD [Nocardioides jishulii]TKI62580.1 thiol reductant ABC exporter subunit CydD [Nocardioides jishulii]
MKPFDPALVPHLLPARRPLVVGLVAGTAQGLLAVAQAWAVGVLIVRLVTEPTGDGWHSPALWLGAVVVARALATYVVDVTGARASAIVSTTLRRRLLASASRLQAVELSQQRTGEMTALATRGMASVEPYLTRYLPSLVLAAVLPAATVATIFWLDWFSGLIVVLTLPLVPIFAILIGLNTKDRAERQWREMATLSGHFLDVVRGLPTLVAHRRATAQSRTIRAVTDRYRRATLETLKIAFVSSAALEFIATISVALVAVVVGLRLAAGGLDFETALIVLLLAPEAYWPWRRVGAEFHAAAEGTATFEAASALLDDGATTPDDTATPLALGQGLRVEGLSFVYPGRQDPALAPLTVDLGQRGLVAVTGPSGGGKSTLLALLLGELTPTTGVVTVDGTPLTADRLAARRATVATAPQRPWLTAGSIAENLRLGRPDAGPEQLWQALEAVDLHTVVAALPQGLDTPLGEDGAGLSAGQRARLGLARVVLAARPVVLLDEPSAHLDSESEAILLDTLRRLAQDALVVVVAHRDTVVASADRVVAVIPPARHPAPADTDLTDLATAASQAARPVPVVELDDEPARWGVRTGTLLGALSVTSGVALTATAAWLITRASEHPPVMYLIVAIVGVRTFGLARPVLRYVERLVSHDAAFRMLAERRAQVYDALVPLVPGRLGVRRGDLLTSVVDDVDALVDEQLRVRQPRATALLVAGVALLFTVLLHPLGAAVIAGLCLVGLAAHLVTWAGVRSAESDFVSARAAVSTQVETYLHSLRQWVLWQADGRVLDDVDAASNRLGRAATRSTRASAAGHALVILACGLGLVLMARVMAAPLAEGAISPAMTALLVMLPLALVDVFGPLVDAAPVAVRTRAARERLDALTSMSPAVTVAEDASTTPLSAHPSGQLEHVSLGWGDTPAVTDLDLSLPAGARVGLVGPSGCGKSTVAAGLLRFLDPSAGRLTWDGTDARALHPDTIRERVGLVDDDPYVFASTVLENVRLAKPGADDAAVLDALSRAHLGPWVASLPHGAGTMVGEGHAHVSGGERARLAMARALLADQPVLVLDEPTAHLDSETARAVSDELLADAGRTVVWITHGTIGLDEMDHVVSLEHVEAPADLVAHRAG